MSTSWKVLAVLLILLFAYSIHPPTTVAVIASCAASVGPSSITPSTIETLSFNITNTDLLLSASWIKISRPSSNFTLNSYFVNNFSGSLTANDLTLTGSTLPANGSTNVNIQVTSGSTEAASADWVVQIDEVGGVAPVSCSGSLGVAISGSVPSTPSVVISNIVVTNITSSSATVTWTTNGNSDSTVEYWPQGSLASIFSSDSALVTSHSINITGLNASSTYGYNVVSADSSGNETQSADNSFTTAAPGSTAANQSATDTSTTTSTTNKKTDSEPPKISLKTNLEKPFKEVPLISGTATDDVSVDKVEYSLDGGKNYIAVKITKGTSVSFSFKPPDLEDGNYDLIIRAVDSSSKTGEKSAVLIIDKLPPAIGGNNIFLGPQNIFPSLDGTITAVKGSEVTIAVNAIGGPTKVEFAVGDKSYGFSQIDGTNIWKGKVKFEKDGLYDLQVNSEDGAGNTTTRKINSVRVLPGGKVSDLQGETLQNARVTLYVFSQSLGTWAVWDGGSFGQENPKTLTDGEYGLLVPPGKYYLTVSASGYRTSTSQIFTADEASAINSDIVLTPRPSVTLFGTKITIPAILDFGENISSFPIEVKKQGDIIGSSALLGTKVPDLKIKKTDGTEVSLSELQGKKTILTFLLLTTWSPASQEQLAVLDRLEEKSFESFPIFMMESENVVKSFLRRGGYTIAAGVDPEGVLLKDFPITSLPQHFILDEEGVVREVIVGAKSQKELREILEKID